MFPSMRASRLLRILEREPLAYRVIRQRGSHRLLESGNGYPDLRFSFHDRVELGPTIVRKVLVKDVGLTEDEAPEASVKEPMQREIRIRYHYEPDGSWWADSPDLERFTAAGSTFEEVREQAREGARFFTDAVALIVEEGVPEEAPASAPDRDVHLVVYEGILHSATSGGGFPTIVMQVDPVGDRGVHVEGAIEDPELVA